MKTVASTLGVARSNLIERRDKVIQARGLIGKPGRRPPTSRPLPLPSSPTALISNDAFARLRGCLSSQCTRGSKS